MRISKDGPLPWPRRGLEGARRGKARALITWKNVSEPA